MSKVFITDYIDNPYIEEKILGNKLAKSENKKVEVLLVWHKKIDAKYIDRFPHLKGIVRYGVGFDNLDLEYAEKKSIYVCNTPDYGTDEVSDTAIGMILVMIRGINRYDYMCRKYYENWQENVINGISRNSHNTLGVIGAGRIGGSILLKAKGLKLNTVFFDPYKPRGYEKMLDSKRVESIEELLKVSNIISINTPLTNETAGLIDKSFIESMQPGSSFINTARGRLVDNIDNFYDALRSNHLANVSLDVLPSEPPLNSKLIEAWRNREEWLDGRLIINPHTSYYSDESYYEMREKAALNAKRILENKIPYNILKP